MLVQNPQHKYYKKLEGTWKNADGSCTAILDTYGNIDLTYDSAKMNAHYQASEGGYNMMMGMAMMGNLYEPHQGEELRLNIFEGKLLECDKVLYTVSCIWYGQDKLNFELINTSSGNKETAVLTREEGAGASDSASNEPYKCECGVTHTGKFCPNCGLPRKEKNTFKCECGYTGEAGNFCPNCGKAIEKEYTCQCGYRSKNVKYCPNCGAPTGATVYAANPPSPQSKPEPEVPVKPEEKLGWTCPRCGAENQEGKCSKCGAEIKADVLFSISTYMSTNPPVTTYTNVYEYSDTQLLLDCNGKRRLISSDVIEPAMAIIKKNKLDDPDFKDPSGIMGGAVYVGFKSGDKYISTSLQEQGYAVTSAQSALMALFNNA